MMMIMMLLLLLLLMMMKMTMKKKKRRKRIEEKGYHEVEWRHREKKKRYAMGDEQWDRDSGCGLMMNGRWLSS